MWTPPDDLYVPYVSPTILMPRLKANLHRLTREERRLAIGILRWWDKNLILTAKQYWCVKKLLTQIESSG